MAAPIEFEGGFVTSREAADLLGYSRPDSLLRAWRAAGLPVYKRASGRNVLAVADFRRFLKPEPGAITASTRRLGQR